MTTVRLLHDTPYEGNVLCPCLGRLFVWAFWFIFPFARYPLCTHELTRLGWDEYVHVTPFSHTVLHGLGKRGRRVHVSRSLLRTRCGMQETEERGGERDWEQHGGWWWHGTVEVGLSGFGRVSND
jgi:hypothetical protein